MDLPKTTTNIYSAVYSNEHESSPADSTESHILDVNLALQQLDGDTVLYRELLALFLDQLTQEFSALPAQLQAVAEGKNEAITPTQRLNHTLKGVASNLALNGLAEVSGEIDLTLKRGDAIHPDQVTRMAQMLSDTAKVIQAYLQTTSTTKHEPIAPVEQQNVQSLLKTLAKRIQGNEFIDDEELSELGRHIPMQQQTQWQLVIEALAVFDFERAHTQLQALLT